MARGMRGSAIAQPPWLAGDCPERRAAAHGFGAAAHPLGDGAAPLLLERQQRFHRHVLVEQIGHHVLGDRRRGAGAAHAVLDHHRAGVDRVVGGREEDEQAVVAIFPRAALAALTGRDAATCAVPVLPPIWMSGRAGGCGPRCRRR
jgi:hypothetical protein